MKKTAVLSGLMALTLLLGGCSAQQAGGETPTTPPAAAATADPAEKTTGVGFYFDTVVTITLYGADDTLMEDIWAACKRYENMLSKTVEGSDVSRINNAHGQTVTVDAETWNVLSEAKKLNRLTGGAFAITIAPLTAQWDFTGGTNRMPTDEERIAALPLVDDEQLTLGENNTVTLPAGMQIDLGGIAKGSGMIHPNLATMLVFLTTDCAISAPMLHAALTGDVSDTFNMVSVDGDTSTNDMLSVMANGLAGNAEITEEGADFTAFMQALNTVTVYLCRCIAGDGEGATKLLECKVSGAETLDIAKTVAKSVICSSLTKAAMFGADANWGRVLCAIGYSGAPVDVNKIDVQFASKAGTILVCENGAGVDFSEEQAKRILLEHEIEILIDLKSGSAASTAWGCDLTYDYVKINGDYRT